MTVLMRVLAVFALMFGLVATAPSVAAGADTLEPAPTAEATDSADATVTPTADASTTATPTADASTTTSAESPEAPATATAEPMPAGLAVASVASKGRAAGSGHWSKAMPDATAPSPSAEGAPPAEVAPSTDSVPEVADDVNVDVVAAPTVDGAVPTVAIGDIVSETTSTPATPAAPRMSPETPAPSILPVTSAGTGDARSTSPAAVDRAVAEPMASPSSAWSASGGPSATGSSAHGKREAFAQRTRVQSAVAYAVAIAANERRPFGADAGFVELGVLRSSTPKAVDEGMDAAANAVLTSGAIVVAPRVTAAVSVAMDFARLSGGWAGPLVFNLWLRRQLRERRMSQRQLGTLSGVNHSTISRLIRGSRTPSLETAAKLVHALRLEWTDEQVATYFDLLPEHTLFPTQRVESALRGDGDLDDGAVRELMSHYLSLRQRRRATERGGTDGSVPALPSRISASGPTGVT